MLPYSVLHLMDDTLNQPEPFYKKYHSCIHSVSKVLFNSYSDGKFETQVEKIAHTTEYTVHHPEKWRDI